LLAVPVGFPERVPFAQAHGLDDIGVATIQTAASAAVAEIGGRTLLLVGQENAVTQRLRGDVAGLIITTTRSLDRACKALVAAIVLPVK
jgi:hypothetical protein